MLVCSVDRSLLDCLGGRQAETIQHSKILRLRTMPIIVPAGQSAAFQENGCMWGPRKITISSPPFLPDSGVSVRVSVKAEFQGILGRLVSLMHGRKLFELETSTRID